ncbi:hypothetical protein IscW_ISCW010613 [Ixodes scapularis]|uniref:Uncharacterized protein n=1 Tax=Ixodes scapularis TaxID=6945 RepID=B7Q6Z5_IXOSC|nr:hypothetical protein IscW_ISCW010613 [Ixodes scapularis]|eukprot:XP_002403468.1 hypothetical protein IscW_ISCW010613 [Ixodes scapularis]
MEAKPAVCSVTRLPEPGPYHSSRVGPGPGVEAIGDPESFDDEKARRRIVNYGPGQQTEQERAVHERAAPDEEGRNDRGSTGANPGDIVVGKYRFRA